MQNSHASCCCLYKQAEPKLRVPMIPTAKLLQLCRMLGLPPHTLALSGFAFSARSDRVLSSAYSFCHTTCEQPSAFRSHVTFSKARNFSECQPVLSIPIASFEADLSIHFPGENNQPSISMHSSNKHPASSQT